MSEEEDLGKQDGGMSREEAELAHRLLYEVKDVFPDRRGKLEAWEDAIVEMKRIRATLDQKHELAKKLTEEVEQLRVQMAGVGVAALGATSPEQRAVRGQYGWSVTYEDVLYLRLQHDLLLEALRHMVDSEDAHPANEAVDAMESWHALVDRKTRGEEPPLS